MPESMTPGRAKEIIPVTIESELKQSYLDYAMSVIIGRALPDVRDGLKPVHRRVLFAMHELSNDWNKPYKKSARIVGDVIGKYHPHGDTAVYDTIVRMAQPFSMRKVLIDGQGNFGSIDGDAPAAMRYTEIRMSKIAHMLLADLDKETVDFSPNYDGTEQAPDVLPTRIPNLLINGSSGIAVGMATNIPPHNLGEVIDACLALIDKQGLTVDELMQFIPGPDFPTAGLINGHAGIVEAYKTGRGRVIMRARARIEGEEGGKQAIIVEELPYQVNKAKLLEHMGNLVHEKRIEGITALRDESDKDGMRIVIEVRRGDNADVILNNLYSMTQLQESFGVNMVALDDGQPKLMNLKEILDAFLQHRREVVTRRTIYDLRKAKERAHVLEGLSVALANIDAMIQLIKSAKTPAEAKEMMLSRIWLAGAVRELISQENAELTRPAELAPEFGLHEKGYRLTDEQAQAILDMRLHRLTGLEQDKIFAEYKDIIVKIKDLREILENPDRLMDVIRNELLEIKNEFADARRSEIIHASDLSEEDLIPQQDVVVTISHQGYAKTQELDTYSVQRRGGKGKQATAVKEEDFVEHLLVANTHDTLLCFSSSGKVYWLKVYRIPQGSRQSRGRPLVNLLPLEQNERITTILPVKAFTEDQTVFMATLKGTVKKVSLEQFSRPRTNGIIAVELNEGDQLMGAALTDGQQDVMLFSSNGRVLRFHESDVRTMGRAARGVRGMSLDQDERIVSLLIAKPQGAILTATSNGYGKRTPVEDHPIRHRGGKGVIAIQTSDRNGEVVGALHVDEGHEVMLITNGGTLVRTSVDEISVVGRNTQGVRLIHLTNGEKLIGVQRVVDE